MQYQSTIFAQLLKALPRGQFEKLAAGFATGRRKRSLDAWGHLTAMVFAQASGARSLRDLERVVERQEGVMAHLGLRGLKRTTLSDANRDRPAALFEAVAGKLAGQLAATGGKGREMTRLIDATRIFAGRRTESWTATGGIKLHLMYDAGDQRPVCFVVTPERVNDITAAQGMPVTEGATYVFDKGYYHYAFWARIDRSGGRFVTRIKSNSPARLILEQKPDGPGIRRDAIVALNDRLGSAHRNPMAKPLRLIEVEISTGRLISLLSNDLESTAAEIADLYKTRWQIELFFKWIKQNLKLGHFLGTSRNAVIIQIMAALIAYMLVRIAQLASAAKIGLQAAARLTSAMLLVRRPIEDILKPPIKRKTISQQLSLWADHA